MPIWSYRGGINSNLQETEVGKRYLSRNPIKQCIDSLNVMLDQNKRRPAMEAINGNMAGRIWGNYIYEQIDGTETLLVVIDDTLYSQNKTTGALTSLLSLGGGAESWFANFEDKCFVTNRTTVGKVEGVAAYQVGISAPSGASVSSATSGGSLADATYDVYVSYARKVSGTNVLFSKGEYLGTTVISGGGGSGKLTISDFFNSSDPQVNNKVVWVDRIADSVFKFFHETGNNSTTDFDITTTSAEDGTLLYSVDAANNDVPPALEFLHIHDNRLWGSIDNTLYYSLQYGNIYDLERFDTTNQIIKYPFNIDGIFSINEHLYLNTTGGIIRQPFGDIAERFDRVNCYPRRFKFFRTVDSWNDSVIGWTNDGCRIFDGVTMSQDLSYDIKPDAAKVLSGAATNDQPAGKILFRDNRTEYHTLYLDTSVTLEKNNRRLVLNLDKLAFLNRDTVIAPWEKWSVSGNYMTIDSGNTMYTAQSDDTRSVMYVEQTKRMRDLNVWVENVFRTSVIPTVQITTPHWIPNIREKLWLVQLRGLAQQTQDFTITIYMIQNTGATQVVTQSPEVEDVFRLGIGVLGVDRLAPNKPNPFRNGVSRFAKGYGFYLVIEQTAEDPQWQLLDLLISGYATRTRGV